jgi:hypothetical protein
MPQVTPDIGRFILANCFDGQRLTGEIDGFESVPDVSSWQHKF